jgi:hypothetical protein
MAFGPWLLALGLWLLALSFSFQHLFDFTNSKPQRFAKLPGETQPRAAAVHSPQEHQSSKLESPARVPVPQRQNQKSATSQGGFFISAIRAFSTQHSAKTNHCLNHRQECRCHSKQHLAIGN